MSPYILRVNDLTKHYGSVVALKNVSFSVSPGSVLGILGPNGSGKTTLLGILLGVLHPTRGRYTWWPAEATRRLRLGALLEQANFYPYLSGNQNLRIVCTIRQVNFRSIPLLLDRVGLSAEAGHTKVVAYSLGMRQRLAIASALVGDPEILVLDEPTNGLDATGIALVRDLITALKQEGKTIILASHLLGEVEQVCSHLGVLKDGELIFQGSLEDVLGEERWIELSHTDPDQLRSALEGSDLVLQIKTSEDGLIAVCTTCEDASELNRYLASQDIYVHHLVARRSPLESQILALLKEGS
jgi:ABC-2 type transport system ATP-binding protein